MDLSPEFINMCREAREIQNHEFEVGDFFYGRFVGDQGYTVNIDDGNEYPAPNGSIWLPRQDQLQEMYNVGESWFKQPAIGRWLAEGKTKDEFWDFIDSLGSYEQLWLCFIMDKLHNKQWDGEKRK